MSARRMPAWTPGTVRLCEMTYWDGGEYVDCRQPATERDRWGMWTCHEHRDVTR